MNSKKVAQFAISLGLAIGLLYFIFKDFNFNQLWSSFKEANYAWVAVSACMGLIAHISRAYRSTLMLEPLGYKVSTFKATVAVLIGYFSNLFLPRAGEFARAASLKKLDNVPFEKTFGAIVAERIIDVGMLFLLLFLNLILEFDRVSELIFSILGEKFKNPTFLISLAAIGLLAIGGLYYIIKKYDSSLSKNAIYLKIKTVLLSLWEGFSSIFKLKKPGAFIFHTALIWALYYSMTYALVLAFKQSISLSPLAGLSILTMGSFGMAAPTIGGLGSYHLLVGKIVELYGLTADQGITLATFLHSMQGLFFVIVFGLAALIISFFIGKKSSQSDKTS